MKQLLFYIFLLLCSALLSAQKTVIHNDTLVIKQIRETSNVTVLFESGMGEGISSWKSIPDSVSRFANILCYNRSGLHGSSLSNDSATIPNMVNRLKTLIDTSIAKSDSLIIVAHSMGGYIARYFVAHYPARIKSLILIDPSPEGLYNDMTKEELSSYRAHGNKVFSKQSLGAQKEWNNYLSNRVYLRGINIPETIPVIIFSSTEMGFYKYHEDLMNNHPESIHYRVPGSHWFHQNQQEIIVREIKRVVKR